MYSALSPGCIGVSAPSIETAVSAARKGGFQGVEISGSEVADRVEKEGAERVRALFGDIKPCGWGMTVPWRVADDEFQGSLAALCRMAKACAAIGCTRSFTWIMPVSDELDFEPNRRYHIARLGPIAEVLAEYGCTFGMEFIGPKTIRDRFKYEFVYRMGDMLDLAKEVGPNAGLLLDCWHWYTSGGTLEELRALKNEDVVYVHVNDAPAGVHRDEQIDNRRALPGETGVIDIKGFLDALRSIGYDGPVVPEPFKDQLSQLGSDEERLKTVGVAMRSIGF